MLENHQGESRFQNSMAEVSDEALLSGLTASQPVSLPQEVHLFDFSKPQLNGWKCPLPYSIGKYDEIRPHIYTSALFNNERDLHVGLDIGGPVNTPVHSCLDGEVFWSGYHSEDGDYGNTVITIHQVSDRTLYILYGHLSAQSTELFKSGRKVSRGELIGWFGDESVNGGWPPHLHIQLSWVEPEDGNLPGVVNRSERKEALLLYPDPQFLIGRKY